MLSWKNIGTTLKNGIRALFKGEFLLRAGFEDYFAHIVYTVVVLWLVIFINFRIEGTFVRREANQAVLSDLETIRTDRQIRLMQLERIDVVRKMLEEMNSPLDLPDKPAIVIKK